MNALYLKTHPGTGSRIVLVHGWAMHGGVFDALIEQLGDDFERICVDLPGHGLSAPIDHFTLAALADHLAKALGEQPAHWLGWSLGGLLCLTLAQRYPKLVRSVGLIASNPCFIEQVDWPGMTTDEFNRFSAAFHASPLTALARFVALQCHNQAQSRNFTRFVQAAMSQCPAPDRATLDQGLRLLAETDARDLLTSTLVPKYALLGGQDGLIPEALATRLSDDYQIPVERVAEAGHMPFLSHPDICAAWLRQQIKD
ncbi:MAG: alpha/beta fold hydrolase [Methylococcales bacterium]|nr:alpha/beta fold hydrolase [Methylococcales bacterium]